MTPIDINKTAELYNVRYNEHGRDIKTVGWGKVEDQRLRFNVLFRGLDLTNKTILDVGCGLGDLVPYLQEATGVNFQYIGIDIASSLIEDATKEYGRPGVEFQVGDIFSANLNEVDISILSGALSFKTEGIEEYAFATMEKMYHISREVVSLNFLSSYVDFELEKNQHYQPEKIFEKAKGLSRFVNLYTDYPLYEFTVQIFKKSPYLPK